MKKSTRVLGIVVILGVAYVGASWYVGKQAQQTIEAAVAQANERMAAMLAGAAAGELARSTARLDIDDYQRRIFSSDVLYTLRMKDGEGRPIDIALTDHLQHGPFSLNALRDGHFIPLLAYSRAKLVATPATQAWVDSQKGESPLLINTRVGFGGAGHSSWNFQPVELATEDVKVSFSGGTIEMDFSNHFKNSTSEGQFQDLAVNDAQAGESLQVKDLKITSQTQGTEDKLTQSQTTATIASLVMGSAEAEDVSLEQIQLALEGEQSGSIVGGSLRYDFGRIAVGTADLGSLLIAGRIQQLNTAALAALATDYEKIAAKHGGEIGQQEALSREDNQLLRDRLAAVLASDPSIAIESLVWKNAKGESKASLQVNMSAPDDDSAQTVDDLFMQGFKQVKFDLDLSKPMFIQAFSQAESQADKKMQMEMLGAMIYDQYVNRLKMAGLIKQVGDDAAASVVYEQGSVNVNGQVMSVPEFIQRVFSVAM
ncbi:YdgA family protein [Pollutimonas harenae]|uniref:YdgA family protein n=1 Tax=Pollutimonas harenae TaxID=657015 RepID=A0A853H1F5_9BURK|nr:YdgA family protein [Pollutimonas harenae]NYT85599.1 YdgA family protein [Pollutimonas harenae]